MKRYTIFRYVTLMALAVCSIKAQAYNEDKEKERCRNPKVQEFTLPEYQAPENKEVQPEAEFTFVVSGWANPKKFKLTGKGMDIPFTVQSTETYHKVKAKLPPEFTGHAVRINARIPAILGCYSTVGWLIKVADSPNKADGAKPEGAEVPQDTAGGTPTIQDGEAVPTPKPEATPDTQSIAPVKEQPVASPPATQQ